MKKLLLKRVVSCFYLFMLCLLLVSFKKNDSILIEHSKELTKNEMKKIGELVYKKLGIKEYDCEIISNFNDTSRYVLIEGDNCYLIYDRDLSDYIEYSSCNNSIYYTEKIHYKKIYYAPTYYFERYNNQIIEIRTKRKLSENDVLAFKNEEPKKKKEYISNIAKEMETPRSNSSNAISHYYYFRHLIDNIGTGYYFSCTYDAISMMLSYYDSVLNDNIIMNMYDHEEAQTFSNYSSISTSSYLKSPGVQDNFISSLITLGRYLGYTPNDEYYLPDFYIDDLVETYFYGRNMTVTTNYAGYLYLYSKAEFCREHIDLDKPVLIGITGINGDLDCSEGHSVVGYEYDTSGIFAHFGEEGANSYVNINNFTIDIAFSFVPNTSHICSNNYIWSDDYLSGGTVCPCGIKTCEHFVKTYHFSNSTTHTYICDFCLTSLTSSHSFYTSGSNKICSVCGYTIDIHHSHSFSYTPLNSHMHTGTCSCGDTIQESCVGIVMFDGHSYCLKCGQMIS